MRRTSTVKMIIAPYSVKGAKIAGKAIMNAVYDILMFSSVKSFTLREWIPWILSVPENIRQL